MFIKDIEVLFRCPKLEDSLEIIQYYNKIGGETDFHTFRKNEYSKDKEQPVFESYNRKILQIVKLKTDGNYFIADGNFLPGLETISFDRKIEQARCYWKGYSDNIFL